jgi:hypothetical protein
MARKARGYGQAAEMLSLRKIFGLPLEMGIKKIPTGFTVLHLLP